MTGAGARTHIGSWVKTLPPKATPRTSSFPLHYGTDGTYIFDACVVAKRLECAELAPAFNDPRCPTAGASSAHSKRFAPVGCGFAVLLASRLCADALTSWRH